MTAPASSPFAASSTAAAPTGGRGMRLRYRCAWVAAYLLVLFWATVDGLRHPSGQPTFLTVLLASAIGVAIVLQASARLPAFVHGVALLIVLPGLAFVAPPALGPVYLRLATAPRRGTVRSASSLIVTDSTFSQAHSYSYTKVVVRFADATTGDGLVRPARDLHPGDVITMDVDRLGLVEPQHNAGHHVDLTFVLLTLLLAPLAALEAGSALVRAGGRSFIAAAGADEGESGSR